MQSAKPLLLTAIVLLAISSASCSTVPIATGCSTLAEGVLTRETPHADIGVETAEPALDWQLFGVAESGQLNKANDDKKTGFRIVQLCEARDEANRAKLNRPFWRLW